MDTVLISECLDIFCCLSGKFCNHIVRELDSLSLQKKLLGKRLCLKCILHLNKNCKLIYKPYINLGYIMDCLVGNASSYRLRNNVDSSVIYSV